MMREFKGFYRFVVFCFVGGTSALIHMVVFNFFFWILDYYPLPNFLFFGASAKYIISTIMGICISIIYNFTMNRNVTFRANDISIKSQVPKHLGVYAISLTTGFIVNLITLNLLKENTLNANIANIAGILVSIPISFFGSLFWTFQKKLNNKL